MSILVLILFGWLGVVVDAGWPFREQTGFCQPCAPKGPTTPGSSSATLFHGLAPILVNASLSLGGVIILEQRSSSWAWAFKIPRRLGATCSPNRRTICSNIRGPPLSRYSAGVTSLTLF